MNKGIVEIYGNTRNLVKEALIKTHKHLVEVVQSKSREELLDMFLQDVHWHWSVSIDSVIRLKKSKHATASGFFPRTLACLILFPALQSITPTVFVRNWLHNQHNTKLTPITYKWKIFEYKIVDNIFPDFFKTRLWTDDGVWNFSIDNGDLHGGRLSPLINELNPCTMKYDWFLQKLTILFYVYHDQVEYDNNQSKVSFREIG